jgi:hypothetical protein
MTTKITRIFLDLDGVLADWATAAIRLHDRDPETVLGAWPPGVYELATVLGISGNALWRPIDAAGAAFWAELEPLPWMLELFEACQRLAPTTILTAPSKHPSTPGGKTAWLQRHFGSSFRGYLIGPDKAACARRGAVLIDDRDEGCKAFEAAGGHAVVFPQPWNSGHAVTPWTDRVKPVGFVLAKLAAIDADLRMGDQLPRVVANAVREHAQSPGFAARLPHYPAVSEATRRKLAELRDATEPNAWRRFESLLQSSRGAVQGDGPERAADELRVQPIYKPIAWSSAEIEAAMARNGKHETRILKARAPGDGLATLDPELALRNMLRDHVVETEGIEVDTSEFDAHMAAGGDVRTAPGFTIRTKLRGQVDRVAFDSAGLAQLDRAASEAIARVLGPVDFDELANNIPPGWVWEFEHGAWQARSSADVLVGFDGDEGVFVSLDHQGEPVDAPEVIAAVRAANPHKFERLPCVAGCGEPALDDDPTCGRDECTDDHRTEAEHAGVADLVEAGFDTCDACGELDKPTDGRPCPTCGS